MTGTSLTPRQQLLSDILVTAVEGGIQYWANERDGIGTIQVYDIDRDDDLNVLRIRFDKLAVENLAGVHVIAQLARETVNGRELVTIAFPEVEAALTLLSAADRVGLRKDIRADVRSLYFATSGDDDLNYDAETADCILQAALFGAIIYG